MFYLRDGLLYLGDLFGNDIKLIALGIGARRGERVRPCLVTFFLVPDYNLTGICI